MRLTGGCVFFVSSKRLRPAIGERRPSSYRAAMSNLTSGLFRQDARRLRLDTLVRLRWLAVAGQSAAVAIVHFGLGYPLPFGACLFVIAVSAALNAVLSIRYPASY